MKASGATERRSNIIALCLERFSLGVLCAAVKVVKNHQNGKWHIEKTCEV